MPDVRMTWPMLRRRECELDGCPVSLSQKEAEVLAVLLMRRGETVLKIDISDALYTDDEQDRMKDPFKIVDVWVCKLRRKVPGLINTEQQRRIGQQLTGGFRIERAEGFTPLQPSELSLTPTQRLAAALRS